jgi:DNA-binding LytR/AlgR family response regulator
MSEYIVISNSNELVRITPDRLVCVESDGNYSTLYLTGKDKKTFSVNLGDIQELIENQTDADTNPFIRIGRSLIINSHYIYSINLSQKSLVLTDRQFQKFKLSASKKALKQLKDYIDKTMYKNDLL